MSHFPLSFPNIIVLQRIPDIHPWIKSVVYQQGSSQESGLEAVEIDDLASIPEVKLTATAVTSFVGGYLYSRQDSAAIAVITAIIAIALGMLFCCGVVGRRPGDDIGPGPFLAKPITPPRPRGPGYPALRRTNLSGSPSMNPRDEWQGLPTPLRQPASTQHWTGLDSTGLDWTDGVDGLD
eukprot:evm.model.scf_286.4 EVM.evm.TU.scf_286.4   scf_286:38986-45380(+)